VIVVSRPGGDLLVKFEPGDSCFLICRPLIERPSLQGRHEGGLTFGHEPALAGRALV
jgi:hypothetical protein